MKYEVVEDFIDLEDNNHKYSKNDEYPHKDKKIEDISKERIKALSTKNNKRNKVLIKAVKEDQKEETKNAKK